MRSILGLIVLTLLLSACAPGFTEPADSSSAGTAVPTATLAPEAAVPTGAEREFSTNFNQHSVPYSQILSGGQPKDGIPAIEDADFVSVEQADDWLEPEESIVLVVIGADARAYPVQVLIWHEIVNDMLADLPVSVTYCPLCNTAIAFERTVAGQVLDFGTTGRLRYSNLIMYDRQTESWWQQATGEAIAGELTGQQLTFLPTSIISWADFKAAYPEGSVLSRETGLAAPYGRNPYVGYDALDNYPFLYVGPEVPAQLAPMARVVGVELQGQAVAYPYAILSEERVVNDTVGETPLVVLWAPGVASPLDEGTVAAGREIGALLVFSRQLAGQTLTFAFDEGKIVDEETGSEWDVLGQALAGPQAGERLTPIVGINYFWFTWSAFKPETAVYQP